MSDHNSDRRRLVGVLGIPVILVGVLVIVALLLLSYLGNGSRTVDPDKPRLLSAATMQKFRSTYDARGMAIGSKDAPLTIREFGDYQCPACGAFHPVSQKIRNTLVAGGKVRYIFFDFPLVNVHENALDAAIAARCAARQDKFWAYHDRLYATQREWSESDNPMPHFLNLAVEAGVAAKPLKQCIAENATRSVIKAEKKVGMKIEIRATPTIIVGNRVIAGAVSYDKIKQIVERQISQQ